MSDDREWLLREFVSRLLYHHPLPWHCESDWTVEVFDAKNKLLMNCRLWSQAEELIRLAEQIQERREEMKEFLKSHGVEDPE